MSNLRTSQRLKRHAVKFDNSPKDADKRPAKRTRKAVELVEKSPIPVVVQVEDPPQNSALANLLAEPTPVYYPPLAIPFADWSPNTDRIGSFAPVDLFFSLFGLDSLQIIAQNTNQYAARARAQDLSIHQRPWCTVTPEEIARWIGVVLYIGRHQEPVLTYFWCIGTHQKLRNVMTFKRFEDISRYITINSGSPPQDPRLWWYKVEPIAGRIRERCRTSTIPPTWYSIDELVIPFQGRSIHIMKVPGKPIDHGYKVWPLGYSGYLHDWLWHSARYGPESTVPKRVYQVPKDSLKDSSYGNKQDSQDSQDSQSGYETLSLTPTYQVVANLSRRLYEQDPDQRRVVFIDNLFLKQSVARVLALLNTGVMGTTRKNTEGFPKVLIDAKKSRGILQWNAVLAIVEHDILQFAWQDNSTVLGMTTAFGITDVVERLRKCPKATSSNARGVLPVFAGLKTKLLAIPVAIDSYNHHMNGVDRANHLRSVFTTQRPRSYRNWLPVFKWLLDTCLNNSYLLYTKHYGVSSHRHDHERFHDELIDSLLGWGVPPVDPLPHRLTRIGDRRPCARKGCREGNSKRPLQEISGNARRNRPRATIFGCASCAVSLCKRTCFEIWHSQM
jgi:hypothetical protein